ncbi:MAG: hypothetical protein ACYC2E_04560 [Sulfuricella sp.]
MVSKKITAQPKAELTNAQPKNEESPDRRTARYVTNPTFQAAVSIHAFGESKADVFGFFDELASQVEAINGGDLSRPEAILITQAHTLNELFNTLARRAGNQGQLKNLETYLRLALKAQGQCRATLETLVAIKNPPVVYAKQANIAHGPQQVNNGVPVHPHVEKNINQQNELLEVQHGGEKMDTRATGEAIGAGSAMATLGEIHRG